MLRAWQNESTFGKHERQQCCRHNVSSLPASYMQMYPLYPAAWFCARLSWLKNLAVRIREESMCSPCAGVQSAGSRSFVGGQESGNQCGTGHTGLREVRFGNLPKRQIDHMEDCHNIDDVRADQDENESELPCWMFDESVVKPFNNWSTTNELKFTDPVTVRRVYALAGAIHDVFTSTGIHYWTSGGTTLGCVRHNGLIPWDDDLDLCIYRTDEHKLTSEAKRLLDDKGFEVTEAPSFGHRVFHKTDSDRLPDCHLHRYPFCDIFVMKTCGGDKCCIENRCGRTLWPNEVYNTKDTKKTERRPFGDLLLNCPANSEDYLSRNYGEEWRTEGATQSYDHTTRSMVKPVRFLLGPEHYQPAKPFSWFWIQHCMSQNYTGGGWEGVLPCISYIGTLRPTWYHFKGSLS